jgi:hypothetical protein
MTRIRFTTALLGVAVLAACSKDGVQNISGPTAGAYIKFYNFGVSSPSVNFFANDTKVTAISSTSCTPPATPPNPACTAAGVEVTTGTAYGSAGNAGLYSTLAPAQYTFAAKVATATDNGLAIAKLSSTLETGKYYSLYTSGVYDPAAKTTDAFIVEDAFPPNIDFTHTNVRFVNAIYNSQPMILYAKNTTTGAEVAVGSTVAYKSGGAFTALPAGVYDLNTRTSGSSTNVVTRTAVSFVAGRVYTVSARGDLVSTVTANKPALDNTANR